MNFFAAFQSEVFRPLVTLLIPGGLAISTWTVALAWTFPGFRQLISRNQTPAAWIILLIITAVGIVIEDVGSRLERQWDNEREESDSKHLENWYTYLRTAFLADPIGRGYIRTVLLRMKFELGLMIGLVIALFGAVPLIRLGVPFRGAVALVVFPISLAVWEYFEAKASHELLARVRQELVKEIRIISEKLPHTFTPATRDSVEPTESKSV